LHTSHIVILFQRQQWHEQKRQVSCTHYERQCHG